MGFNSAFKGLTTLISSRGQLAKVLGTSQLNRCINVSHTVKVTLSNGV